MIESLPEIATIATAAGLAAGTAADMYALRQVERNQLANADDWGESFKPQEVGRFRRVLKSAISELAIFGALTGGINAVAYQSNSSVETKPASIELVVDASGSTIGATAEQIGDYAHAFSDSDEVNVSAVVTSGDKVFTIMPSQVGKKIEPIGDAALDGAFSTAFGQITGQEVQGVAVADDKPNSAVVLLTNGSTPDDLGPILEKAEETNTPISVVNTQEGSTDDETSTVLRDLAKQTGGDYWDAKSIKPEKLVEDTEASVSPITLKTKEVDDSEQWILRGLGLLAFAGAIRAYKSRRNKPTNIGVEEK